MASSPGSSAGIADAVNNTKKRFLDESLSPAHDEGRAIKKPKQSVSSFPENRIGILVNFEDQREEFADVHYSYKTKSAKALGKDGNPLKKMVSTYDEKTKQIVKREQFVMVRVVISKRQVICAGTKLIATGSTSAFTTIAGSVAKASLRGVFTSAYATPFVSQVVELVAIHMPTVFVQHAITEPFNCMVGIATFNEDQRALLARFGLKRTDTTIKLQKKLGYGSILRLALYFGYTRNPILQLFPSAYQLIGKIIGSTIHDLFTTVLEKVRKLKVILSAAPAILRFASKAMGLLLNCLKTVLVEHKIREAFKDLREEVKKELGKGPQDRVMRALEAMEDYYCELATILAAVKATFSLPTGALAPTDSKEAPIIDLIRNLIYEAVNRASNGLRRNSKSLYPPAKVQSKAIETMTVDDPEGGDDSSDPEGGDDPFTPSQEDEKAMDVMDAHTNCCDGKDMVQKEEEEIEFFRQEHIALPKDAVEDSVIGEAMKRSQDFFGEQNDEWVDKNLVSTLYKQDIQTLGDFYTTPPTSAPPIPPTEIPSSPAPPDSLPSPPPERPGRPIVSLGFETKGVGLEIEGNSRVINYRSDLKSLQNEVGDTWTRLIEEFADYLFNPPAQRDLKDVFTIIKRKKTSDGVTSMDEQAGQIYSRFLESNLAAKAMREKQPSKKK